MGVLAYERGKSRENGPTLLTDGEWEQYGGLGTWVRAHECYDFDSLPRPGRARDWESYNSPPMFDSLVYKMRSKPMQAARADTRERPQDPIEAVREKNLSEAQQQVTLARNLAAEASEHERAAKQLRVHAEACVNQANLHKKLASMTREILEAGDTGPVDPIFDEPGAEPIRDDGFTEPLFEDDAAIDV